jgi:hypothetical protein
MFLVEFAASQAVQQSRTLIINGQSGQVSVLKMNGRSFVDLEALAQLANGSLGFHGDQIVLSLPASAGNVPAKAPSSCQPALSSGATIVVNLLGSRSDIEKSKWRLPVFHKIRTLARQTTVPQILRKHFHRYTPGDLVTTCRTFPPASRVDLQLAVDEFFAQKHGTRRLDNVTKLRGSDGASTSERFSANTCQTKVPAFFLDTQYREDDTCRLVASPPQRPSPGQLPLSLLS